MIKYFSKGTIILFCIFECAAEIAISQSWTQLQVASAPSPRRNASLIYDPNGNRLILFGGRTSSGDVNDLWNLNLSTYVWQQITPSTSDVPRPRFTHNAVYDSGRNRMLIWSGENNTTLMNDVWAFNLSTNMWEQLWADSNVVGAPLRRYGAAAVLDPLRRRLINFAGFTTSGRFEDTWYFHIDSTTWTDMTNDPHPLKRCLHTACLAVDRRQMIIYGGSSSNSLDDIWSLDIDTFQWTDLTPSIRPSARYWASSINDDGEGVIIFGGETAQGRSNEMWRFSLAAGAWDSISQGPVRPPERYGHAVTYISQKKTMIIFGGLGTDLLNDTWEFSIPVVSARKEELFPDGYFLAQNYPNPFNSTTAIEFKTRNSEFVRVTVFSILGAEVSTVVRSWKKAGRHVVQFDAQNLPAGMYVYRIQAGSFVAAKRMVILK